MIAETTRDLWRYYWRIRWMQDELTQEFYRFVVRVNNMRRNPSGRD